MLSTDFSLSDLQFMLAGAWVSLQLTLWAMLIGTLSGAIFGLVRAVYPRASAPLGWLLDVFRCVPLLIQFVLFNSFNSIAGINWTAFAIGCLVLGIYCASYCTEVVRGGLRAVPANVVRAARSLGRADEFSGLDQFDLGRDQRHLAGVVDRHHGIAARLAVHRHPDSRADTRALDSRADVLHHELGHCPHRTRGGARMAGQ